jgi:surface protein
MSNMFFSSKFNGDISQWNVSNVTNMDRTFVKSQFNGDISKWDVSKVEGMVGMFKNSKFNGDISNWTVKPEGYIDKAKAKPIAKTIPKAKAKSIAKTNNKPLPASYLKPQGKLIPVSSLKTQGKLIYIPKCMKCHLKNGTGMPPIFPALKGSKVANGADHLNIDIVLNGKDGMPNHKKMSDLELASVITYIRSSFGNKGNPVFPYMIKSRRK